MEVKEIPDDWYTLFDPELELDLIIDARNIIKTIYNEEQQKLEAKSH